MYKFRHLIIGGPFQILLFVCNPYTLQLRNEILYVGMFTFYTGITDYIILDETIINLKIDYKIKGTHSGICL